MVTVTKSASVTGKGVEEGVVLIEVVAVNVEAWLQIRSPLRRTTKK
jgi:hypothetical protein